ncbi:Golgi complex component 7-domain-containing protein [Scenedesmus sp. NREL 46B-D3]|nr:Golgi complex component 7-domain-containing protein [Scenedesmus sp. NREL 46B-D3]
MTDLAVFAEEGFDPKAWINEACTGRPPAEPLERFLSELEMRLQLGAEEVEAGLTQCSGAGLRRVPFALQEAGRLRGDVAALQATTRGLLGSVAADAEAAAAAAAPLAALHTARTNMEAGCATLREAAELSGAFKRVEEVFAAGDLPGLALVGDVPEFREGRSRLAALEDRLQRRVEGRLGDALQANASQDVSSLAALLLAVGRYSSLEAAYVASRLPLVAALWDEAAAMLAGGTAAAAAAAAGSGAGGLGGGWLLLLYNGLMGLLEGDAAWLAGCLPGQQRQLLVAVAVAAFEKLNKSLRDKLAALHTTRVLAGLLGDVLVAARRLRELMAAPAAAAAGGTSGDAAAAVVKLLKLALDPVEQQLMAAAAAAAPSAGMFGSGVALAKLQQISRYTSLEEPVISAALSAPLPINTAAAAATATASPGAPPGGITNSYQAAAAAAGEAEELEQDVAQKLSAAVSAAFSMLSGVVERCMALTGGTELPLLLASLDRQLAGYLQRLQAAVGIINGSQYSRLASAASPAAGVVLVRLLVPLRSVKSGQITEYTRLAAASSPAADVSVMLQLVLLARHISSRLNALETHLRSTLSQTTPRLQALAAAGLPPLGLPPPAAGQQQQGAAGGAAGIPAAAAAAAAELLPLRLAAFPDKLLPLAKLQASAASSRFMSLPSGALCEAISSAVYDALLAPVVAALAPLPGLPDWGGAGSGTGVMPGAGAPTAAAVTSSSSSSDSDSSSSDSSSSSVMPGAGAVVPSFSAYPLAAVTAVGEYLMALPQQLEVLMGDEAAATAGGSSPEAAALQAEAAEGDELAAEWLDKVVRGAGLLYADAVLQIRGLSPSGGAQLAADAEYFCNVMSALAVAPPPALVTAQLFAAAPADAFVQLADGAVAGGSADVKLAGAAVASGSADVLKAIAGMRRIEWSGVATTAAAAASGSHDSAAAGAQ